MPYTKNNLPPQAKNLTDEQKEKFIDVFNSLLKEGIEEEKAITVAISKAKEPFKNRNRREDMSEFFENQWVEVFRVGEQTDASGDTRVWTDSDLNKIVKSYDVKKHEAPLVVGHPSDNAPAFGWVDEMKTDGKILFAKFKQLVPEFLEAVKNGLYKKRSISLYPDLTLRHIGFLGAVPPAVKGLANIKFNDNENVINIEFTDNKEGDDKMPKELLEKIEAQDTKIEELSTQNNDFTEKFNVLIEKNKELSEKIVQFEEEKPADKTENDEKDKDKKEKKDPEFEEQQKRITNLEIENAQIKKASRMGEYKEFVNKLHSEGKIVSDKVNDLIDFLEAFNGLGEFNFTDKKESALDRFKSYLEAQPQMVDFDEKVKKDKTNQNQSADFKLNEIAQEKAKKENISYSEALFQAQEENADLAQKAAYEILK